MSNGNESSPMLYDVLGSATAGIISRVFTHPLDTAKARLQAPTVSGPQSSSSVGSFRGPLDAIVKTYRYEGFRALYGGFGAVIVGGTPGTVLYLAGYAYFRDSMTSFVKRWSGEKYDNSSVLSNGQEFVVHFSSGMLAETVTCIIYVPVDVVKERMQVQQAMKSSTSANVNQSAAINYQYKNSWDALQKIVKSEGLRGIYKGYGATLASFGPFSALYFVFYEKCKAISRDFIQQQNQNANEGKENTGVITDGDLPLLHLVACSSGAGALASFLTSPLDMAKLRLQVQRGKSASSLKSSGDPILGRGVQYRGMVDCLRAAYAEGGVQGLFRGAGARVLHFAPATTITMTCYEKCKSFYADAL
mmetsp:Transcript_28492/g.61006  ORF Transcript_28492/g.61006 Transcript_28492/m.61006 type:complete len:361 (+) Transcript_28492:332-1414(+)|eukprot:CAMPEP_0171339374 /NCGR_PEP_ID=MMETSP0878-20121228/7917_1 /TAXON_ID=67004 /ORGANISM="Thalassiosira weissflogii, Strain CCMP1336" /LENGTH=360 /DNA_ID=CAMNT_0011841289 /DNA_START=199 /DNA_END=1281 /DNA_ORIENTATION=-